jgi:PII-like signaling protein
VRDLFGHHEVATSVMLRGIASFVPRHVFRTDESLSLSEDPPVAVVAVDSRAKIAGLVDDAIAMTTRGLLTLQRARLLSGDVTTLTTPGGSEPTDAVKLTIYVGRQERMSGMPAHIAVCDLLYRHGFAGAWVFLGVYGTAHGQRHRARFFSRNVNVPMMIIAVGSPAQVSHAVPELGERLRHPLLTVERLRLCKRDGALLARPHALPAVDEQEAIAVAEADGPHLRGHPTRRPTDPQRADPAIAGVADRQWRNRAARHLGISWGP